MSLSLNRLVGALVVSMSALGLADTATAADTVEISYLVPFVGISLDYRAMGYSDPDGNFVDLAGQQILSSTVEVDFTPAAGVDWTTFTMDMVVPVSGSQSQYFAVLGSDLVETTPGTYHYALTTDAFNGTIYDGRFSVESYGLDENGNPVQLAGTLSPTTGFYYTVTLPTSPVPEPAPVMLLAGGLALVAGAARRKAG